MCKLNLGHLHFRVATAVEDARVRDGLAQHAQRIVQRPLCLVQQMRACVQKNTFWLLLLAGFTWC